METEVTQRRAIVNKYSVAARLATRGRGKLYRAVHADSGRPVVVREFTPGVGTPGDVASTQARIAAIVSRFIVSPVDVGVIDEQTMFIAHPQLSGESLTERLERRGALSIAEAAALCARVLKGLETLHTRGLVHGALRPTRIFHENQRGHGGWHIKILGAGVPSVSRDECRLDAALASFAPPEWLDGGDWIPQSDVFCIAGIFYECVVRRGPFAGADGAAVTAMVLAGEPTPLRTLVNDAPPELEQLLLDSLARDPAVRPATSGEMLDRLLAIFPENAQPRSTETGAREHWTRGGFVGRPVAGGTGALRRGESKTQVVRKQQRAERKIWVAAVALTALCAAALIAAFAIRVQRRERELLARLAVVPPTASQPATPQVSPVQAVNAVPTTPTTPTVPTTGAMNTGTETPDTVASRSGSTVRSPRTTARTPREDHTAAAAPPAGTGMGLLDFRSSQPCSFVLDGSSRGETTVTRMPLRAGVHQITCHNSQRTDRIIARIYPGRSTRVRISSLGETEVSTDEAPAATPAP